ncbi:MAG: hypothetical protein CL678_06600 [Bdellovibrionaceae bacterium]|nr:hypothetical protein [Pseudobdellovibrionaceae bacterium]
MIEVSVDQLSQVEYLIEQSKLGNHILFDSNTIRNSFESPFDEGFSEEDAYAVEHHIERIITQPSIERKKAYLDGLNHETHRLVVRTYLNIVENNLYDEIKDFH